MKLYIFTWNLGANSCGGASLLQLIDAYAGSLDGEFLAWVCELGTKSSIPYLKNLRVETPDLEIQKKMLGTTGVFLLSKNIQKVVDPEHAEHIYNRSYSAHFKINDYYFPVTGLHFYSQGHQRVGAHVDRRMTEAAIIVTSITEQWIASPTPGVVNPSAKRHIILGDFNDEPFSESLTYYATWAATDDIDRVKLQEVGKVADKDFILRYNPARSWNGSPRGSFYHKDDHTVSWKLFDQILLGPSISMNYIKDSLRVLEEINGSILWRNMQKQSGQVIQIPNNSISDHFPVQLTLEIP